MRDDDRPLPRGEKVEKRPCFDPPHGALQLVRVFGAEHGGRSAQPTPKGSPDGDPVEPAHEIRVLSRRPAKAGLERVLDGVERDLGVKDRCQNSPIDLGKRTAVEPFPYLWIQRGHTLQTHDNPLLLICPRESAAHAPTAG